MAVTTNALGSLFLFSWLWSISAPFRGEIEARCDIALGRYEVLGYGLLGSWRHEYARLLRERYSIRFRTVALCIVSEDLRVPSFSKQWGCSTTSPWRTGKTLRRGPQSHGSVFWKRANDYWNAFSRIGTTLGMTIRLDSLPKDAADTRVGIWRAPHREGWLHLVASWPDLHGFS